MADCVVMYFQAKSKYRRNYYLWIGFLSIIFITVCSSAPLEGVVTCEAVQCVHGICQNSTESGQIECVCEQGWTGKKCDSCGGRQLLTSYEGYITDGPGNYTLETKCSWLIEAEKGTPVRLRLESFATECSWDHLYVYDGDSVFSPLIAAFSGLMSMPNANTTLPEIQTESGSVYLHFYSDAAYNMSGFNIEYSKRACPLVCEEHGVCQDDGSCECDDEYRGESCSVPKCPNNCNAPHGRCEKVKHEPDLRCHCDDGYRGADCSTPDTAGSWTDVLYSPGSHLPSGRASHKSVVADGYIWVVSGFGFNHKPFENLLRYDIAVDKWDEVVPSSELQPTQRYGHSLVLHKQTNLYMYGGLVGSRITHELWLYNISANEWIPIDLELVKQVHPLSQYLEVVGHTAHVIGDDMYVIFGHSPVYGYLNTVQKCNLNDYVFEIVETRGALVKGTYGHSSVWDEGSRLIYVHGGYFSSSESAYDLSDRLYAFNPEDNSWRILSSSGNYKYLHSAALTSSGLMLVFGGNTHNDTSVSRGAKCYSAAFMAYDIACDAWHSLPEPAPPASVARFGHIAEIHDDKMYVFGGFNGLMLRDMFVYTPANCKSYVTRAACQSSRAGVRCAWSDDQTCLSLADAHSRKQAKVISTFEQPTCQHNDADVSSARRACSAARSCPSCVATASADCVWCGAAGKCQLREPGAEEDTCSSQQVAETLLQCAVNFTGAASAECHLLHNCHACHSKLNCAWNARENKCQYTAKTSSSRDAAAVPCEPACHTFASCENCTGTSCMWCSNQQRCVESNSYVASFPYGQCMEWTTARTKCEATRCASLRTCEECQQNPACGWCDDASGTGLGACMEGGASAPRAPDPDATCPAHRWYFVSCPLCQCNGHATCAADTSECAACGHLTTGDRCQHCMDGYHGTATNGGNCTACNCSGNADTCNRDTGLCYCRTKGVIGRICDQCDESKKYYGNPRGGGTCYYDLATDYQFTFNLSKDDDKYYTQINFMNTPLTADRDVDFSINCTGRAYMNITVRTGKDGAETMLIENFECHYFKAKFKHTEHKFGRNNTTFHVYVYDFTTPFFLQISFSQFPQIDLVHFFVTFFSCFLSLLLVAAVLYKLKHRYDLYRRHQRMEVEMEQMASRPVSTCVIELPYPPDLVTSLLTPATTGDKARLLGKKLPADSSRSSGRSGKDKKPSPGAPPAASASPAPAAANPSPVALEPLAGGKSAILSLVVRLPTGDADWTPPGQPGLCVGSALVCLGGQPRRQSVDFSSKTDKKTKKNISPPPDNCV